MDCNCNTELKPWQQPLLTQRRGIRSDTHLGRLKDAWLDGRRVEPGDVGLLSHLRSTGAGAYAPKPRPRGDSAESPWQWGTDGNFGGAGTQRVGPGWGDSARFDVGEIQLVIDGAICQQDTTGKWLTPDGKPCPLSKER